MQTILCKAIIGLIIIPILLEAQGLIEDFNDGVLDAGWAGTGDYQLTETDSVLRIDANKRSTWNSFTFSFPVLDMSDIPYISLKVKPDKDLNLGFSVWDDSGNYAYASVIYQEIVASSYFQEYTFDFSGITGVNLSRIVMLNFVFNPGGAIRYEGIVYFDDLRISGQAYIGPSVTTIPTQFNYINTAEQTLFFRGISDPLSGEELLMITAVSSNTALIPNPRINYISGSDNGSLTYQPAPDRSGIAVISLTVTGNAPDLKTMTFDVNIEKNQAPHIDPVDSISIPAGQIQTVVLTGVSDGNPNAEQAIEFVTFSSDTSRLQTEIQYTDQEPSAILILKPSQLTGPVPVSLILRDDGGTSDGGIDSLRTEFQVMIYESVNQSPTLDPVEEQSVLEGSGEQTILLTGISDGDSDADQSLTWEVFSSDPSLIPVPEIDYENPDSTAFLKYRPVAGLSGRVTLTLTLSDDGGTASNNGNASVKISFDIIIRPRPTIGFEQDYEDGNLPPQWPSDWDPGVGENCHRCSIEDGALKIEIDKNRTGNIWAGLWFNIAEELDLSEYPYISITMKTSVTGTEMLIFLWDAFDHYNTGGTVRHRVTEAFTEYYFDFTGLNLQGDGTEVDFSRIKALLINFDPGQSPLFTGNFWFEDLRVGTFAHRALQEPVVTMNPIPDFSIPRNALGQTITLTGISDGSDGTHPVYLTATSSSKTLIPDPEIGPVTNGTALLTFTPTADRSGSSTVNVTASAEGSLSLTRLFRIEVKRMTESSAVHVQVDLNKEYQTIDGFGAFMGSGSRVITDSPLKWAADLGMTMARFGVIDVEFEPVNDNSDPMILNWSGFDENAVPLETMRRLRDQTDVDKFILSFWSPPAWMKRNKCLSAESWATDNKLEPFYYEEYAEHVIALIKTIKFQTGIELYALSLQNEPQFNEPYASCQVDPDEMKDLIKIVGPRLEAEGLNTRIFWAEALPAQNMIQNYIRAVQNDLEAAKYADIVAIHNYDADGIHVGGAGAQEWARIYDWAQEGSYPYPTWMTETSGHANSWDGALELAGNIFNALGYGNVSAWCYWSFNVSKDSEVFGLVVDNEPTSKYYVSKQYYQFIRPGAVRVEAESDGELPILVFNNRKDATVSIVMINARTGSQVVQISGSNLPPLFESYTTSNFRNCTKGESVEPGELFLVPASSITTLTGALPTSVEESGQNRTAPLHFALYQNYPNPFNPLTTIPFQIPASSGVSLTVYDILGREVCVLTDAVYRAGNYRIEWNGSDRSGRIVSSGIYFIRLQTDRFTAVKKAVLLR
jgi:glucuronoarabinoxylan endo-1,4-beta-xylanase